MSQKNIVKNIKKEDKRKIFSFFLLLFPTLIIAIIPSNINGHFINSLTIKSLLFIYQSISIWYYLGVTYDYDD